MSRGLGAVQRHVLERLARNTVNPMDDWTNDFASWVSMADLADANPTRSQIESIRRAVLKLHTAGKVDVLTVYRGVRCEYAYGPADAPRWLPKTASSLDFSCGLMGGVCTGFRQVVMLIAEGGCDGSPGVAPMGGLS
jgi:hypothetical protein